MSDDVLITHRHPDAEQPMLSVDDTRIDGLRVRKFACDCGFGAAILSKVEEGQPGTSWPFTFESPRDLA